MSSSRPQKIIMLGETDVGKTAILQTYIHRVCPEKTSNTLGACFHRHSLVDEQGEKITMDLWDTAGQEKYRSLLSLYYKNTDGVVITFDLSNPSTFEAVRYWTAQIEQNCEVQPCVVLVGNKSDLLMPGQSPANSEQIKQFVAKKGWKYIVASAKQGKNIEVIFTALAAMVKLNIQKHRQNQVNIRNSRKKVYKDGSFQSSSGKKDSCC